MSFFSLRSALVIGRKFTPQRPSRRSWNFLHGIFAGLPAHGIWKLVGWVLEPTHWKSICSSQIGEHLPQKIGGENMCFFFETATYRHWIWKGWTFFRQRSTWPFKKMGHFFPPAKTHLTIWRKKNIQIIIVQYLQHDLGQAFNGLLHAIIYASDIFCYKLHTANSIVVAIRSSWKFLQIYSVLCLIMFEKDQVLRGR